MSDMSSGGDDNTELFNYELNVDPESAKEGLAQFDASINQSAENAAQAADTIKSSFDDISSVTTGLAGTIKSDMTSAYDAVGDSIQAATDKLKEFQATQDNVAQSASGGGSQDTGGDPDGGVSASRVGRSLFMAGRFSGNKGVSETGGIIYMMDALNQIEPAIAAFGASITGLEAGFASALLAIAPVALAVGAIAAAFNTLTQALAEDKKALEAALETQKSYYEDLTKFTTDEAQAKIDSLQIQADVQQKAVDEQNRVIQSAFDQYKEKFGISLSKEVAVALPGAAGGDMFRDLYKQLDQDNAALATTNDSLGRLQGGLQSNAFAANDAIAAIDKQIQSQRTYNQLIASGNVDEVNRRIQDDQGQIEAYNQAMTALDKQLNDGNINMDQYTAKWHEYHLALIELGDDQSQLTNVVLGLATATKDAKTAIDDINKGIKDAEKFYADTQKFNEQEAYRATEFKTKQAQEQATFDTKIADDTKKHNAQMAKETSALYAEVDKITSTANASELKAQQELVDKTAQINQDLADKIAEIQGKAREDELDAASHLDARKIAQLQRQEAQQIDTATKAADKQKAQLEKETETKVEDLKKSAEQERDQRLAAGLQKIQDEDQQFKDQRQQEITNFNTKMQNERDNEAAADAQRRTAFAQQESALAGHMAQMLLGQTNGQNNILLAWNAWWGNLKTSMPSNAPTASNEPFPPPPGAPITNTGTVTNSQFQSASAAMPDPYSMLGTPYANSYDTSGVQQMSNPDVYSNLLASQNSGVFVNGSSNFMNAQQLLSTPVDTNSSTVSNSMYQHLQGFASGGESDVPFYAGEGGRAEMIIPHGPSSIFSGSDTQKLKDMVSNGGGSSRTFSFSDGAIQINGSGLNAAELKGAVKDAFLELVSEEAG